MASADIWWFHTLSLLHMDGTNGGTTFTDENPGITVTVGGAVVTSTSSPKYGTASGSFPGADADKLTLTPDWTPDFDFGTADFTLEGWFKESNVTKQYMMMLEKDNGSFPVGSWALYINYAGNSSGDIAFANKDYHATTPLLLSASTGFDDGAWHHVAVCRSGNQFFLFVDGVPEARTTFATSLADLTTNIIVGNSIYSGRGWQGNLDDWRITKGHARYTVAFTPIGPHPEEFDTGDHTGATGAAGADGQNITGAPGPAGEDGEGGTLGALVLPSPPAVYSPADQAQTRRLIEQAFRS